MLSDPEDIETIFAEMREQKIDTSQPLRYGYFFFHGSRPPLEELARWLVDNEYEFEDLSDRDSGDWVLWVAKTETHSIESLQLRNEEMNRIAKQFGIRDYDGWDVGVE